MNRARAVAAIWVAVLLVVSSGMAADGTGGEKAPRVKAFRVFLRQAMPMPPAQTEQSPDLLLDLELTGDKWGPVFGIGRNFNMASHYGRVVDAKSSGQTTEVNVAMTILGDNWIKGGTARYSIRLVEANDGAVGGTYQGEFCGLSATGTVVGALHVPALLDPQFIPVRPGEHPRILFRAKDLPALRERAKTPLGQAALAMVKTPMSLGLKYQLTGDKQYADAAMKETEESIGGKSYPWYGTPNWTPLRPVGSRWEQIAIAYDLCYDAWPKEFRDRVGQLLRSQALKILFRPFRLGMTNWTVFSNHVGGTYAAAAFAGMALMGEPCPPATGETNRPPDSAQDFPPEVVENLHRVGRLYMYLLFREAVGTGGYHAETAHYHLDCTEGPGGYATAHRQVFGYDASPYPDITHYIPCMLVAGGQDISGWSDVRPDYYSAMFPIVPEPWKPAVLTAWNEKCGVKGPDDVAKVLDRDGVRAFLNYPLDMKPGPMSALPLTWEAPDYGYYAFRSGWEGQPFVSQVFLKSHFIGGWNAPNAGTFRIAGLGHLWACGVRGRQRNRFEESVVELPEDKTAEGALGRCTYFKGEPDGSGVVSVNLDDVYAGEASYSTYGNFRKAYKDSGIRGMRSIAVDYSGKSGAPLLFVAVDKISGGGKKIWRWQTPGEPEKCVKLEEQGFTIAQGDATLRGRFVAPAAVTLKAASEGREVVEAMGKNTVRVPVNAVSAEGGDSFFFVCTIQQGPAPAIEVQGSGLDAVVTVGKRQITFDGEKVVVKPR